MENLAHTVEEHQQKPSVPTLTRARVRKLLKSGFDTKQIAEGWETSEAQVYNVLAENET